MIRDLQEVRDGFRRHRRLSVLHSGLSETSGPLSVWMHRWSQFDLRCRGGLGRIGLCRPNLCVFSTCSKTTRSLQPDGSLIIIILTIPSSESTSRSEGWSEFLRLLSKYLRKPLLRCFMGEKKKRGIRKAERADNNKEPKCAALLWQTNSQFPRTECRRDNRRLLGVSCALKW